MVTDTVNKDEFAVGSLDWVRWQAREKMDSDDGTFYPWVRDVYPDKLIVENEADHRLYEVGYSVVNNDLVLGSMREVAVQYAPKSEPSTPELTGPIVAKDAAKRIVYAPVLVPEEPDSDGDVVSAQKIEDVAHGWLSDYQNIDYQHSLNNIASPVESYIAPVDLEFPGGVVPKGSWMLAARVPESIWPQVVDGTLTGFSLMAVKQNAMATVLKDEAALTAAWKRTTISDLGDDWVVPFVSLVSNPAVPAAKWVAIKSAERKGGDASDAEQEPKPGLMDRVYQFIDGGSSTKAGRRISDRNYERLKSAMSAIAELIEEAEAERSGNTTDDTENAQKGADDMNEDQVKELVQQAVADAVGPAVKAALEQTEVVNETTTETTIEHTSEEADDELNEELTALKTEQESLKGEVEALKQGVETLLERIPAPSTRAIKGQDGGETVEKNEYEPKRKRDAMGRPVLS